MLPADPEDVIALGRLEFDLGVLHIATRRLAESEASLLSAAARFEAVEEQGVLPDELASRIGSTYQRLAFNQWRQGKFGAALASAERAVREAEALLAAQPDDPSLVSLWGCFLYGLAEALDAQGRTAEALARVRRARGGGGDGAAREPARHGADATRPRWPGIGGDAGGGGAGPLRRSGKGGRAS